MEASRCNVSGAIPLPVVDGVRFALVPNFPAYAVGDDGSVWSRNRKGWKTEANPVRDSWVPMKLHLTTTGRLDVNLSRNSAANYMLVHRLVLTAFVGPCPKGMEACHNDGNPLNNRLENLRWDTRKANHHDKKAHGTWQGGENHGNAKLTEEMVRSFRQLHAQGRSMKSLSKEYGLSLYAVWAAVKRKTWSHVP